MRDKVVMVHHKKCVVVGFVDDLPAFENEWREKTSKYNQGVVRGSNYREIRDHTRPHHQSHRALPEPDHRGSRHH